jgi:hypothetical protein
MLCHLDDLLIKFCTGSVVLIGRGLHLLVDTQSVGLARLPVLLAEIPACAYMHLQDALCDWLLGNSRSIASLRCACISTLLFICGACAAHHADNGLIRF